MNRLGRLGILALAIVVVGCASGNPPAPRSDPPVRTRCLTDRNETGNTRPLFFLFCMESP